MIEIIETQLNVTFPITKIKMVVMQPYIHLTDTEPFHWPEAKKAEQIQAIQRTLDIASHNGKTHFTLFPEYSIPGLGGVGVIDETINTADWDNGTVVIGGIDGLSKQEYAQLCNQMNIICSDCDKPDRVPDDQWVNCCITWVKGDDGDIKKYIQPKLCPSEEEWNVKSEKMFCGGSVRLYESSFENRRKSRFFSLICYDWIGTCDNDGTRKKLTDIVTDSLNTMWANGDAKLVNWIFLLQYNKRPSHSNFTATTEDLLTQRDANPFVDLSDCAIVAINSAAKDKPCRDGNGAFTSFVFRPSSSFQWKTCLPTVSTKYNQKRPEGQFTRCNDAVLREMGACVHKLDMRIPCFVNEDNAGKCPPIEDAHVYRLTDNINDPRLPGNSVPACVKWINDQLDETNKFVDEYDGWTVTTNAIETEKSIRNEMRWLSSNKLHRVIHYATCNQKDDIKYDADEWGDAEALALELLLYTLTIYRTSNFDVDVANSHIHATIKIDDDLFELCVVNGDRHDECIKHFEEHQPRLSHKVILIIKDRSNFQLLPKVSARFTIPISSEKKITEAFGGGLIVKAYSTLAKSFQDANTLQELSQEIKTYVI